MMTTAELSTNRLYAHMQLALCAMHVSREFHGRTEAVRSMPAINSNMPATQVNQNELCIPHRQSKVCFCQSDRPCDRTDSQDRLVQTDALTTDTT